MKNSGDGHFFDGGFYTGLNCAQRIMSGDLNGDCISDVVTNSADGCSPKNAGGASVSFGRPDGTFMDGVPLQTADTNPTGAAFLGPVARPRALAIVDLFDAGITVLGDPAR